MDLGPIHCGGQGCHKIDKRMYLYGDTCDKCHRTFCVECAAGGKSSAYVGYTCKECPW